MARFGRFLFGSVVMTVAMFQVGGQAAPIDGDLVIEPSAWWQLDRLDGQPSQPLDGTYSYGNDGHGVTIYILDTSVLTSHSEFGGRATAARDGGGTLVSFGPAEDPCSADDPKDPIANDPDHGHGDTGSESSGGSGGFGAGLHGTVVASLAAGHVYGVAKGATIVSVPVLNHCEILSVSGAKLAMEWVIADVAARHTRAVVNMSFVAGSIDHPDSNLAAFEATVNSAVNDHGIVVVAAAGNDRFTNAGDVVPAGLPSVIAVGGSSQTDTRWTDPPKGYGSSFGSAIALFAPAENLVGASNSGDADYSSPQEGTSGAAPLVAGLVARYLQARPNDTPAQVRAAITAQINTTTTIDDEHGTTRPLAYTGFVDLLPDPAPTTGGASMSEDSAVRQCSNYVEESPVSEPDSASCLTLCEGAGANACEWNAVSHGCFVEFGQGCFVEGGHGDWWAAVLTGTPPPPPPPTNMSQDSAVRQCSNYVEQGAVSVPNADACFTYCQGAGADACEWNSVSHGCFVEFGQGCVVEGGHGGWYAAVLNGEDTIRSDKWSSLLPSGAQLKAGQSIAATNGAFRLTFGTNGELLLTGRAGTRVWSSQVTAAAGGFVQAQDDGNLVAYDSHNVPIFWTGTGNHAGGTLQVSPTGGLRIVDARSQVLWSASPTSSSPNEPRTKVGVSRSSDKR